MQYTYFIHTLYIKNANTALYGFEMYIYKCIYCILELLMVDIRIANDMQYK